ncbi:MAG TPA: peptidylprolyl isomerase [Cytophagales bacterium]|jgi:cyclophilin family peptidyl-prolyl cis-trans isomerase|nr:peptidylprolyl isomerase [Cytophagales bacterium]
MKYFLLSVFFGLGFATHVQAQNPNHTKKDYVVSIATSLGEIKVLLFDETPIHKANFVKLSKEGFYNGTTFHRIIDGFMIQGGDPNSKDNDPYNDGQGGAGYTLAAEFNPKFTHVKGAVAAARMGDAVNPKKESSGCQFYIVENNDGAHFLDNQYTVFGQVIMGIEVVEKIAAQAKDGRDRPINDIKMTVKTELLKKKKITKLYGFKF